MKNVQVGYEDGGERHVDKGGQKDGRVGGEEVDDEDFADHGLVMGILGFVVLEEGKPLGEGGEVVGHWWDSEREQDCWCEDEDRFEGPRVDFGDKDLDCVAGADNGAETEEGEYG